MKWSKKNKELIKQVIDRYHWMLEKKSGREEFMYINCPFCPEHCCGKNCPNVIISILLNCQHTHSMTCIDNAKYIGLELWNNNIRKTPPNIKKRLRFWEDAIALTKKEFTKKYKKILDKNSIL